MMKLIIKIWNNLTGVIVDTPVKIVASKLRLTEAQVIEAKKAGCRTYEEIEDYFNIRY